MKVTVTILALLVTIKVAGQSNLILKADFSFYLHSVDSMIKYILTKENPSTINLLAEEPIINIFPNTIHGLQIIKLKKIKKRKPQDKSFYIYISKLGGTATIDKRGVFLVVAKCNNDNWTSWEGYGGYDFDYILDPLQNTFVLKEVTKTIMIR
jgi:hypothetical protein